MTTKTKVKLLEAAKELLMKDGVHAFSMRNLVKSSGISSSTLYRHFRSKDDILLQLFFRLCDRHLALANRIRASRLNAAEQLIAWMMSNGYSAQLNLDHARELGLHFIPCNPGLFVNASQCTKDSLSHTLTTLQQQHHRFLAELVNQGWVRDDKEALQHCLLKLIMIARGVTVMSANVMILNPSERRNLDLAMDLSVQVLQELEWLRPMDVQRQMLWSLIRTLSDHR